MPTFLDKLARAKPGDEIVYHEGLHIIDTKTERRKPDAQEAWAAYVRGDVILYQRRIGPMFFQYCANVVR